MAKGIPTILSHYWEDGVTIECRYFPSRKSAIEFAKANGYINYKVNNRY